MSKLITGSRRLDEFTNRHPYVGPAFWIASIQFFLVQAIAAMSWATPYSLTGNTISDLGNTVCGIYSDRYVCSPLHSLMNASLIVLGITMVIGAVLIYHEVRRSRESAIGFGLMALGGVGTIMVGLFPENTISILHTIGAGLPFVIGNIALLVLSHSLDLPRGFRFYTLLSGIISLSAFLLLLSHTYFGIGIGGMERLTAHPQTIWLIALGIYMSRNYFREPSSKV